MAGSGEDAPPVDETRIRGGAMCPPGIARGLSLRAMARRLGMTAHAGLSQYERGRRLPPADIVAQYERVLGVTDGELLALHSRVLAERASRKARALLASDRTRQPPEPDDEGHSGQHGGEPL